MSGNISFNKKKSTSCLNFVCFLFSDKSVRLYKWNLGDTFTEVPHSPLLGHTYAINSITFSPFGTKLASAGTDGLTIIWEVKVCLLSP